MSTNKSKASTWGEVIKADIMNIKQRLTAVEVQIQALQQSGNGNFSMGTNNGISSHPIFGTVGDMTMQGNEFFSAYQSPSNSKDNWVQDLVDSTYAIKTATIAVKGYTSALQNAGLSGDQKKLLKELAEIELAAGKALSAIQLINVAMGTANPVKAAFTLIMAGGFAASGAVSASKISGEQTKDVS